MAVEPQPGSASHVRIGAVLLIVMGGLVGLLAIAFFAYAWLFANRAALPAWVDASSVPDNASGQLLGIGLVGVAFAGAQIVVGWLALRGASQIARWAGVVLALLGAAVVVVAMLPRDATQGLLVGLFPGVLAYAWVLVAFAVGDRWFADAPR